MIKKNIFWGDKSMDKRYQVFISSTFADLEEERKNVMEAIIELDCFPAGMEMFPASDQEQFDYIKSVIANSDYYVLILAGRYGSLANDGLSYTEKEFDYAVSKGIPILVFAKRDLQNIALGKTDQDERKKIKLNKFREKAMSNRLSKFWDTPEELKYAIHSSLSKAFISHPRKGWIRGMDGDIEDTYKKIVELQKQNELLKEENTKIKRESEKVPLDEIKKELEKEIDVVVIHGDLPYNRIIKIKDFILYIGTEMMKYVDLDYELMRFAYCISGADITDLDEEVDFDKVSVEKIKIALLKFGIIEIKEEGTRYTETGKRILFSLY